MVCCICVMSLVLELLEGVGSFLLICEKWLFYCSMAHILHFQMDLRCFLFPQKLLFCDNSLHLQSGINNFSFYSVAGLWCVLARYLWDGEDVPSQSFSVSHIPSQGAHSPIPSCPNNLLDNTKTRKVLKVFSCNKWTHGLKNQFQLWKLYYLKFKACDGCDVRGQNVV